MSVLLLPPIFQFFDDNGDKLANGFVYTYAAGTTTPLATYTDASGTTVAPNPIQLNAAGRPNSGSGAIWGQGAYKFKVTDANGVQVGQILDNVTSFAGLAAATNAYAELFSGNGVQTVFTTSTDLGTDPKALLVSVATGLQEIAQNGSFTTDTLWTKGAGWTIGSGVATATGAISTAISQAPVLTVVAGQAYAVTYTITRSAGGLIPSIGGQSGTERTASGTYREIIIAAGSTPIAFTGNAFTGTLDNVSVTVATNQPMALLPTNAYTINGTTLTFATAPALGVTNIDVRAPSSLVGAASTSANLAQLYAANALTSQTAAAISASSAAGYAAARNQWTFSATTTMAAPGTANLRLNNATFASVTAIAISDLSANVGNPDLSGWISTWDDAGGANRGSIFIFKDNGNFAIYNVNSALIDNTTWYQVPVTYVSGAGSFSASDALLIGFSAAGTTLVSGGITQLTGNVTASGAGSVAATIANSAITPAKMASGGEEFEARNYLTNGTMAIDQRNCGTAVSLATTSKWALDQWAARQATATPNVTTQRVASGIANTPFALKVLRASGADTTAARVIQVLSSEESWPLAGKTITVSFQLLKGSACSNTTLSFFIYTGTGTDQTVTQLEAGSWTGVANTNPLNLAFSGVTTSFAQYSFTTTVPSNANQLALLITNNAYSGSGSANDFYTITDICLTPTTTVVPVPRRHPDQELVLCEKYYQKSYDIAISPGSVTSLGVHQSTAATAFILANGTVYFKKRFRATPTVTIYSPNSGTSGVAGEYNTGGTFVADRAVGSTFIGQTAAMIQVSGTATVGNDIRFQWAAEAGLL